MNDLLVGAGLVLVFEGMIWAISPASAKKLLDAVAQAPEATLRSCGVAAVMAGMLVVWLVRG